MEGLSVVFYIPRVLLERQQPRGSLLKMQGTEQLNSVWDTHNCLLFV